MAWYAVSLKTLTSMALPKYSLPEATKRACRPCDGSGVACADACLSWTDKSKTETTPKALANDRDIFGYLFVLLIVSLLESSRTLFGFLQEHGTRGLGNS